MSWDTHPLSRTNNITRSKLDSGDTVIGLFLLYGNASVAETCSTLALDWLIVDMEASPVSKQETLHIIQALTGTNVTPMVRVPSLERAIIEHVLDLGAHAVLVPKIDTASEAMAAAMACRYPPMGSRGVNPVRVSGYFSDIPKYLKEANRETLCMVQIESAIAVANAGEIASVPGVDVLFIGCGDLASSLGQPGVVTGPAMDDARRAVLQAAHQHGKVPGIFAYNMDLALEYAQEGFRFIAIGNDVKAIRESVMHSVEQFRNGHRGK